MIIVLDGHHGGSLSIFLNFQKIQFRGGVAAFFKNRGQFTKSSFCCLLPVFVPIRAIKWLFFIEFDLFGQSEC